MDRRELIQLMVLNEISDDYENVDQVILPHLARDCCKLGFTVARSEIVDALAGLLEAGLAKAYFLSGSKPHVTELPSMPPLDVVEEDFKTYFYITKKGMEVQLSDDVAWPFDDDGNPRI